MAFKVTIAGTDQTALIRGTDRALLEFPLNGRATARFTCNPSLIPARFAEVVFYAQDGTTPNYGGVVISRRVYGILERATPSFTAVECGDFGTYADWCSVTLSYTVATAVEDIVDDIVDGWLSAYGITYTPAATGLTVAPFAWVNKRASDALRELCDKAGLVFRFGADKALLVFVPGASAAPVSLTDAATNCEDLEWSDSDWVPANKVVLSCGTGAPFLYVGQRTANGTATSWVFDVRGYTSPWAIKVGAGYATVTPVGGGGEYEWDEPTYTLTVGTASTPTNGTVIEVSYWVSYPFTSMSPKPPLAATPPVIEYLASAPDIIDVAAAQDYADGLLAQLNQSPREVRVQTRTDGFWPGQALTIALTARTITGTFSVTAVSVELITGVFWRYSVTATESTAYQGNYLEQWRDLTGGGLSSVLQISGSSAPAVGMTAYLGGSRGDFNTSASWEVIQQYKTFRCRASGTYTFWHATRTDSTATVQVRLYDVTAAAAVTGSTSTAHNTATWTEVEASVSLVAGHRYYAQIVTSSAGVGVYCGEAWLEL